MQVIWLVLLLPTVLSEANDSADFDDPLPDEPLSRFKRQFWYASDYGGFYTYNSGRVIALIIGIIALAMCCLIPCICIIGIWFAGWFGIRESRKRRSPKGNPESAIVHEPVRRGYAIPREDYALPREERTEAIVYETKQRDRYYNRRSPSPRGSPHYYPRSPSPFASPRGYDDYEYYKSSRL